MGPSLFILFINNLRATIKFVNISVGPQPVSSHDLSHCFLFQ